MFIKEYTLKDDKQVKNVRVKQLNNLGSFKNEVYNCASSKMM